MSAAVKKCIKCGAHKSYDDFHRLKASKDGLYARCKSCQRAKQRTWRKANPDKLRAMAKRYRQKHPEKIVAQQRRNYVRHTEERKAYGRQWAKDNVERNRVSSLRWQKLHPEYRCEQSRKYREAHPERCREAQARWRKQNPDKARATTQRRLAKKRALSEMWTAEMDMFVRQFFDNRCGLCNAVQQENGPTFHIDHWRPLSRGYALTIKNAALLCPACNCRKQAKIPEDCYSACVVNQIDHKLKEQCDEFQRHVS